MNQIVDVYSSLQIVIWWIVGAWRVSAATMLSSISLGLLGVAAVFFIVPRWIQLWKRTWNPIGAVFVKFVLSMGLFFYSIIFVGYTHQDSYLERLIEEARKEASAPYSEWCQIGFPIGINVLNAGTNVCVVLQKQAPRIQEAINKEEPFISWPSKKLELPPMSCEKHGFVKRGEIVQRGDECFNSNFNNIFNDTKKHFMDNERIIAKDTFKYISLSIGICFLLGFAYLSLMAFIDLDVNRRK